jgi:hypothetical protein
MMRPGELPLRCIHEQDAHATTWPKALSISSLELRCAA